MKKLALPILAVVLFATLILASPYDRNRVLTVTEIMEWSDTLATVITVSDTTVMSARISAKPDSGAVGFLNQAETISGNWVNTANPWADNEIASAATWNNRKDSTVIVEWSDTLSTVLTMYDTTNMIITVSDTVALHNQIAARAPLASPTFTGTLTIPTMIVGGGDSIAFFACGLDTFVDQAQTDTFDCVGVPADAMVLWQMHGACALDSAVAADNANNGGKVVATDKVAVRRRGAAGTWNLVYAWFVFSPPSTR